MAMTNKEYEVEITIARKSVIIPKGLIASFSLNAPIVEFTISGSMYPEYKSSNTKSLRIEFKEIDNYIIEKICSMRTSFTAITYIKGEIIIDSYKPSEFEIKLLHD